MVRPGLVVLEVEDVDSEVAGEAACYVDPADPMDRIDPAEPMQAIEPAEPMEAIEPADPIDAMEPTEPSG